MGGQDIERWDRIAEEYDALIRKGDLFREHLLNKVFFDLLGEVKDKKILDAGCGQGYLAKTISEKNAIVTALDGSEKLIELAKKNYGESENLSFSRHDLRKPLSFPDSTFDIILGNMVLMDLDPIEGTMREFGRILKNEGIFLFSILHPLFTNGTLRKTIVEKIFRKIPHYAISTYITKSKKEWRIPNFSSSTYVYHRPLEYYFGLLNKNNFFVSNLKEPVFEKDFIKDKNNFLKLCSEIPIFLVIKAVNFKNSFAGRI